MQLDTNTRLADRVDNIRVLKDLLERTAAELEREINNLNEAKQNLEYALDQRVGLAVHINVENLVSREGRRDGDIIEDVIEVELHKVEQLLINLMYCRVSPRLTAVEYSSAHGQTMQILSIYHCSAELWKKKTKVGVCGKSSPEVEPLVKGQWGKAL